MYRTSLRWKRLQKLATVQTAKGFSVLWSSTFLRPSSSPFPLANVEASMQGEVVPVAAQVTVLRTKRNHCDSSQVFPLPEGVVSSESLHALKCQHPQMAWRWGFGPLEHNEHTCAHSITHIDARAHEHTHTQDMNVRSFLWAIAGFGSREVMERKKGELGIRWWDVKTELDASSTGAAL